MSTDEIRQTSGVSRGDTRAALAALVEAERLVMVKGAGKARTVRYAHDLLSEGGCQLAAAAPLRKPEKLKPDVARFIKYVEPQPDGTKFTALSSQPPP